MQRRRKGPYEVGESSRPRDRALIQLLNDTSTVTVASLLPSYLDNGDCCYVCEHCGAYFWLAEKVGNSSTYVLPKYNQCCKGGAVCLPLPLQPLPLIRQLYSDSNFMENIRAYNNMFSMTSFGAQIDHAVNDGRGPYVFKVSGQICHWIGSLCPPEGQQPRFLQLYIYDTVNEVSNRLAFFPSSNRHLYEDVVAALVDTLRSCNEYVRLFKTAIEMCDGSTDNNFCILLYNNVPDRRYAPPAPGTLGGIVRDNDLQATKYDIVIHKKDGQPQRVSKLHPSYMPLQYPLLFPFAEQGWSPNLLLRSNSIPTEKRMTVNMYYSYQIHDRHNVYLLLLNGERLFQQYLVDAYTCIEQNRLDYISTNQDIFRSEYISRLYDTVARGDTISREIGKCIFLPSSFVGGPRYMYKHYLDALAICRVHGNPQYFVTFTCNTSWPEITRTLHILGLTRPDDRPDIVARVFQMKVQEFLKFIKSDKTFGEVTTDLYTIEFQRRGLPHCHTLVWVKPTYRIRDAADVDKYISAEIPNPETEPELYKIVTDCMMHGPCGLLNPNSPCMRDNKCSKSFPKPYEQNTRFDKDGYVHYRRHFTEHQVVKNGIRLDNGFVVPYNKRLLARFHAHINVEHCGWNMMIKYLFKYISKGADRVRFTIAKSKESTSATPISEIPIVDEIKNYINGRYICPHEASWRILNLAIHERNPAVQVLAVHLENMQSVTFNEKHRLQAIIRNPAFGKTTLTQWLRKNNDDEGGRCLTYIDYPTKYRWEATGKAWITRAYQKTAAIGRLTYMHASSGELFYLRMLLRHQQGCKSFADIRTVFDVVHSTYRAACEALGLIGNDNEWLVAFVEAAAWATSVELRTLFTHMLLFCEVSQPLMLWETQWKSMADDIRSRLNSEITNPNSHVNDTDLQQFVLVEIEQLLNSSTPSRSLADFGLPLPSANALAS